jgi:hypothetical protein
MINQGGRIVVSKVIINKNRSTTAGHQPRRKGALNMTAVIEDAAVSSKVMRDTGGYAGEMQAQGHEDVLRQF